MTVNHTNCSLPSNRLKLLHACKLSQFGARSRGNGFCHGVFACKLQCTGKAQHFGAGCIGCHYNIKQLHDTCSYCAGFVKHHGVNTSRALQYIDTLDHDAHLCCAAAAHHQRSWSSKSKCARARNDQHRNCGFKCIGQSFNVVTHHIPRDKCGKRQQDHSWHKHTAHAIGKSLHWSLSGLCVAHKFGDLRKCRVGSNSTRTHYQSSSQVHCCSRDLAAYLHINRHAFACER